MAKYGIAWMFTAPVYVLVIAYFFFAERWGPTCCPVLAGTRSRPFGGRGRASGIAFPSPCHTRLH